MAKEGESQQRYDIIHKALPEGVLITDERGMLVYVNPALEEMFGTPSTLSLGTHFRNYIAPASVPNAEAAFLGCAQGKVIRDIALQAVHHDGHLFAIEATSTPIFEGGKFRGVETVVRNITERRLAEDARRESEQRFREVLENSLDIAYRRDLQNDCFDYLSPVVKETTGFTWCEMREFTNEELLARVHPDDVERVRREFAQALETCKGMLEYRFQRKDGVYRWLADYFVVQKDELGRPRYCTGNIRDVTEIKQTERALRSSERRYRKLFESELMGVFVTRPDGTFLDCNEAMVKMLGYDTREEVLHHRSSDFYVDPEFRQEAVEILRRDGVYRGKEGRVWRKDGSIGYLLGAAVLLQDEETGAPYVQGVAVDITERKQAEEALQASEQRYRKLFEANLAGVYLTKPDGTIIDFNETMMRMLGYDSREELMGHRSTDFYVCPELRQELMHLLQRDGIVQAHEAQLRRKDGSTLYALGHAVLLRNDQTGEPYIQGIAIDITRRKQVEEELRELTRTLESKVAQRTAELRRRARQLHKIMIELSETEDRERRRLAQILHDDLQQQLAGARFHVELLKSRVKNDASLQDMAAQIDQMLEEAIGKSRSLSHELSPVVMHHGDFVRVLQWLAQDVRSKHGLDVQVQAGSEVQVESDAVKSLLYRTAQELLFNVAKHAQTKAACVRVRQRGACIGLLVSDRGRGFDPQEIGETVAFGLLSIRERVELLKGRMKIKSAPGRGSRVSIVVPTGTRIMEEVEQGDKQQRPSGQAMRVLLADDHEIVRQGLTSLLQEERAIEVVGEAATGQEAVDMASHLKPDVVVMDATMPGMDGAEATRRIKKDQPQARVVALSMHKEPEMVERMYRAGADAYILKTAPSAELLTAIRAQPSNS